ncbi:MAG TPA: ankyrin repeat domain-containing protein [Pyrinomonadaceae bacterium]
MKLRRLLPLLLLLLLAPPAAIAQTATPTPTPSPAPTATPTPVPAATPSPEKQKLNDELYEAVRKGDVAAVKATLDKGADVNAKFRYGATALFKAAERGNADIVKLLIERGADVTVRDTFYGATAMTWALDKGHVDAVRAILEKSADDAGDVLSTGARGGNAALVRAALDKGNLKPESMTGAFVAATEAGDKGVEIVEMLKKAGAQPPAEVDAATLQTYVGRFKGTQGPELVFSVKDGKLIAAATGQPPLTMYALDKMTFKPTAFDGITVIFTPEAGKVNGFTLKQGPATIPYTRVEETKQQ